MKSIGNKVSVAGFLFSIITLSVITIHSQANAANDLILYPGPSGATASLYFTAQIRTEGGTWQNLFIYDQRVCPAAHTSFAYFDADFSKRIEVKVIDGFHKGIGNVRIRPRSLQIPFTMSDSNKTVSFFINRPCKLSIEFPARNQFNALVYDIYQNLHIFANSIETNPPQQGAAGVKYYGPGITNINANIGIASNQTIYIAGGALVRGNISASNVNNVTIRGRGILDVSGFSGSTPRPIAFNNCSNVTVEGIILTNAENWEIVPTASDHVNIKNVKELAWAAYSDGVDIVSSQNVTIDSMFIRNYDDCISIKASGSENNSDIIIRNCVFWNDNAHTILIGPEGNGGSTQRVTYINNEVVESHGGCPYGCGVLAICSGDNMTMNGITFQDIKVDSFTAGDLVNLFIETNEFTSSVGKTIRNVLFKNITFNGFNGQINRIWGYDATRMIDSVTFENLMINGKLILNATDGNFNINNFASHIVFKAGVSAIVTPDIRKIQPGASVFVLPSSSAAHFNLQAFSPDQPVHITIRDANGRQIKNVWIESGIKEYRWKGADNGKISRIKAGIYFYTIQNTKIRIAGKIAVL
jgi:hypothetical protein